MFVLSQAVRDLLKEHPDTTFKEFLAILKKKNPKASINPASASQCWSTSRSKAGLSRRRRKVGKRSQSNVISSRSLAVKKPQKTQSGIPEVLRSAAQLLQACGGNSADAIATVKAVAEIQGR